MRGIADARKAEARTGLYEDLLEVSRKMVEYARAARRAPSAPVARKPCVV